MQVVDGSRYAGRIKIGEAKLDFEVQFTYPIHRLPHVTKPKDVPGLRGLVQIKIYRKRTLLELTDYEYDIFNTLLTDAVIRFYYDPKTRVAQKGLMGELGRGFPFIGGFRLLIPTGETSAEEFTFTQEAMEHLRAPKFGCVLK